MTATAAAGRSAAGIGRVAGGRVVEDPGRVAGFVVALDAGWGVGAGGCGVRVVGVVVGLAAGVVDGIVVGAAAVAGRRALGVDAAPLAGSGLARLPEPAELPPEVEAAGPRTALLSAALSTAA